MEQCQFHYDNYLIIETYFLCGSKGIGPTVQKIALNFDIYNDLIKNMAIEVTNTFLAQ